LPATSSGRAHGRDAALDRDDLALQKDDKHQMPSAHEGRSRSVPQTEVVSDRASSKSLLDSIVLCLDEAKAEEVVTIDLHGKSTIADYMVVASGRSDRHVSAIGEQVQRKLKEQGFGRARAEGMDQGDWVLIDAGSVIVHIFRPEVREFYKLERMWAGERPADSQTH
jgi:ribosome-associated protein